MDAFPEEKGGHSVIKDFSSRPGLALMVTPLASLSLGTEQTFLLP